MKIAKVSARSNIPLLACNLNDVASPRSSLCRILALLQEEGPALGIIINLPKCEVFSQHGLDMFPLGMKKSEKPNMEILGIPIGDQVFVYLLSKKKKTKMLSSQIEEVEIVDLHNA